MMVPTKLVTPSFILLQAQLQRHSMLVMVLESKEQTLIMFVMLTRWLPVTPFERRISTPQ